jgi:hypothetical protein
MLRWPRDGARRAGRHHGAREAERLVNQKREGRETAMKRLAGTVVISLALGAAAVPALAAGGASGWSEITLSQEECIASGRRAVQQLGFDPSNDDQSVFGWRNDNLVAIRCIASKTVAVFFSYMPTEQEARALIDQLRPFFQQPATPPGK